MASASAQLTRASKESWKRVASVCEDAAVFLDRGAAEHLHWTGGIGLLGRCVGAYDLYEELGPVARDFIAQAPYCHVVIVVTEFLHGACSEAIAQLLSSLRPLECHVFCGVAESLHAEWIPMPAAPTSYLVGGGGGEGERELGEREEEEGHYSHYGEFQALMKKWMDRESGVRVSVSPVSLFQCEVVPGLLISPSFSSLCPLLPCDTVHIQAKLIQEGDMDTVVDHLGQVEFSMLSHQLQTRLRCFSSALSDLLGELNMREDIFSLGSTSHLLAHQLAGMPQARIRRKNSAGRCSILLVDRSLDLAGPSFLSLQDSLADRLLSSLPHLPAHTSDVAVNLTPIITSIPGAVLPGSLAQPQSQKAVSLLKTLIFSKPKEALMEVSRGLLDALSQESLSVRLTGSRIARSSAAQLRAFLEQFRDHQSEAIHQLSVLQLGCAVVQALEAGEHWENRVAVEKTLLACVSEEEADSVLSQLTHLAGRQLAAGRRKLAEQQGETAEDEGKAGEEERGETEEKKQPAGRKEDGSAMSLAELLSLAVCMYSLVGDECGSEPEERKLREVLSDLVAMRRECDAAFTAALGIGDSATRREIASRMRTVFETVQSLGATRDQLKKFGSVLSPDGVGPQTYQPLLTQVVDAIFSPSRPDLPDIQYHSHGFTDILKSGFSLFMSSARPRPNNHPLLLIIVVGGVTCTEVKAMRDTVTAHRCDTQVVVLSTRLLSPNDLTSLLLAADRTKT